ncbi:hypothetical protein [Mesorhizobium sp. L2C084A000]|uniref:hypothetical protein n=1 Tax=Mesorhizobium sp. L2C084A000 TaxID=1287116 RepID=UPI0003D0227D|nr:hypothetical protein [Mesorhizobium sp. L2C084A000]ESZ24251.1 hypothetical protein X734_23360 [Mesorhizobium sp. L2C084A000]
MKPIVTEWTVVAVGSWNLAILNPDWFAKNVFDTNQLNVELILENFAPRLRFVHDDAIVIPSADRMIIGSRRPTDSSLAVCEKAMSKLLQLLPVTPIAAVGVNFGYDEADPPQRLFDIFKFSDASKFIDQTIQIIDSTIARQFSYDKYLCTMTTHLSDAGSVQFKFNYNANVENSNDARAALDDKVTMLREYTERLLGDIYGITGEQEND